MIDDPWKGIPRPDVDGEMRGIRVDSLGPFHFFWGLDRARRPLLVLRHSVDAVDQALPTLNGLEVKADRDVGGSMLVWRLMSREHLELFYGLCEDIVRATAAAGNEAQAIQAAVLRTWRWHHLLRGGGHGRLSIDKQMGLLGELYLMETLLMAGNSANRVIGAWKGPLGAAQDYDFGGVVIEVKSRATLTKRRVRVSSEHQLDGSSGTGLYLVVATVAGRDDGVEESLDDVVARISQRLSYDPLSSQEFTVLLEASGYHEADQYQESRWGLNKLDGFTVVAQFPCVVPSQLPAGVSNVKYDLSLPHSESFRMPMEAIIGMVGGSAA